MARSTDPRHGIWILPLVIVGMVGTTTVFVNSLNPGTVPDGTGAGGTLVLESTTSTAITLPEETTTTTLEPVAAQYVAQMDTLDAEAVRLVEAGTTINADWDARNISFQQALEQLRELRTQTEAFATEVEVATPTNLPLLEPAHLQAVDWARAMVSAAEAMVVGLQDPNSSEGRQVALTEFQASGAEFSTAVDVVGAVARGEDPTGFGATDPGDTGDTGDTGEFTDDPDTANEDVGDGAGIDE